MRTKTRPSRYVEYAPPPALDAHLACVWTGETGDDGGYTDRVLPDACIDLIWDGTALFVAGPDTGPVVGPNEPGGFFVGARFRPGHAPGFLGVPASEIVDQRVDVDALWGGRVGERLRGELAASGSLTTARHVLERHLHETAPPEAGPTPMLDHVVHLANDARVDAIADGVGVTTRTLHRRCVDGFGYGAKTLQSVLRFRRFLSLADAAPGAPLAQLAFMAGYADQPHLTRECRRLSGLAPRALRRARTRTDR